MKRIIIPAIALAAMSLSLGAQDMYYAKMLSTNNYYGTARTIALGNAVTALGGDLGTIGINPAGSAVAGYWQFTMTPGLNLSVVSTGYEAGGSTTYTSQNHGKFIMPNIGLSMIMDSGNDWGLKRVTFAVTANTTNYFLGYSTAMGDNSKNSMLGNFAAAASSFGYYPEDLSKSTIAPWDLYASYAAGQFLPYGENGQYAGGNQIIGPGDTYCYVPDALNQFSTHDEFGHKTDIVLNLGFDVSDRFYFGFNLGIPTLSYCRQDYFCESAKNPERFPIVFTNNDTGVETTTYFKDASNVFKLMTDAEGIYAKFGFICVPVNGLRIGAAIQSPTAMTISEQWINTAETSFADPKFDGSGRSPEGEYQYNLRTPWSVNAGLAYTFGGTGLISVDYEMNDFSVMKYSDMYADDFSDDGFRDVNFLMNKFCGVSHSVRAGLEYKFLDMIAVRGGYSITTDPERIWTDSRGHEVTAENYDTGMQLTSFKYRKASMQSVSAGVGYSSPGSFFVDFAARVNICPEVTYMPYYYDDYPAVDKDNHPLSDAGSPVETIGKKIWDVVCTIGWRF